MDDEVKEYWEGFDAAEAEEEEGRGKSDKFYRKKGDNIILMDNRGTPIQPLNPQQTTKET